MMPETGNLENLYDIVVPGPVSWWPAAPGWYVIALILVCLVGLAIWHTIRQRRRNRFRREALVELDRLFASIGESRQKISGLRTLPELVKRTALAGFDRTHAAQLSGAAWLEFLDQTGSTDMFTKKPGSLLSELSFQKEEILEALPEESVQQLLKLVRQWIKKHRTNVRI